MLRQSVSITLMNLRNITQRLTTSLVVVVGIAGVVAVLVGLLSMAAGFQAALSSGAAPNRGIILGHGSRNEMNSWLTIEEYNILSQQEDFNAASGEFFAIVDLVRRDTGETGYVVARGITPNAFTVRPELSVTEGRLPRPGVSELLVGSAAADQYLGLDVGKQIDLRGGAWTVVGTFDSDGASSDAEIWMDVSLAQSVFRRDNFSTMRVTFSDLETLARAQERISADPRLDVALVSEDNFFSEQAEVRTTLIETFTYFIASIMAVGAVVAALNSMYVAVSSRKVEIATLRALGFRQIPIVTSVMAEALFLALIGGGIGAALVYYVVDGYTTSTLNAASNTHVGFSFVVDPDLLVTGLVCAIVLGFVGGLLPALHAARAPLTSALAGR